MKCPNCGNVSDSNAKFCCVCGAKLEERKISETEANKTEDKTENKTENETKDKTEHKVEQKVEQKVEHKATQKSRIEVKKTIAEPKKQSSVQKKKRKRIPEIVIAGGLCAAIVVAGVFTLPNLKQTDNPCIYLSDGSYNMLAGLEKSDGIEFSDGISPELFSDEYWLRDRACFSPGGKYLYFFRDYDSYSDCGTLCRVRWNKLRKNASREKNSQNVEVICTNMGYSYNSYTPISDEAVIYKDNQSALYYYNGKETTRLAKKIKEYVADEKGRIIYTRPDNEDETASTMYGLSVDNLDDKKKLASNVNYIVSSNDLDNIFVSMDSEWQGTELGVTGFNKEFQILGESTTLVYVEDDRIYYMEETGERLDLYDYVEGVDVLENLEEPSEEEYQTAYNNYEMLSSDSYLEDYDEIYTSCTKESRFTPGGECLEDQPEAEFQEFVNKYKDLENEDGYFVVTEEIANDLRTLAALYGEGYEDEWLEFCFAKSTEYVTDEDAYDAAWNRYYKLSDAEYLCEKLKDEGNAYRLKNLYCCQNGEISLVAEDVLNFMNLRNSIAYNTKEMIHEKVKLEDITSESDVTNLFVVDPGKENYFIRFSDGRQLQMSAEGAKYWEQQMENGWAGISMVGDYVYINDDNSEIGCAHIENDKIGTFETIDEDSIIIRENDNELYYASAEGKDETYYDLYYCKDGKREEIATGITLNHISVYADGKVLASTSPSYEGYELSISGIHSNMEYLADDVTAYWRLNENDLFYISDGDLYLYDGKEKELIAYDVDYMWCLNTMETTLED